MMSNNIFGLSEQALGLCEERSVILSNNIVNSSTPNFKARDIDFRAIMGSVKDHRDLTLTDPKHIALNPVVHPRELYRIPHQTSLDGNTVDPEIERKNFMQNAVRYQVNLTFIKNETNEMLKAMKGE